jgi:uncharacterized membrane protein YedE/YeeE
VKAVAIGFAAGLLFGAGLIVARMTDPRIVLAFLDVAGAWNPSLLFVMAGAAGTFGAFYAITIRRRTPLVGPTVQARSLRLPSERPLDARLFLGTAIFGLGWGLVGLCPGPALTSIASGSEATLVFVVAMIAGIGLAGRTASVQADGRRTVSHSDSAT